MHHSRTRERTDENLQPGETIIIQGIISGILLVVVLLVGLVDVSPAVAVRGGIREVLSGANTVDELITDVRNFGDGWLGREAAPPPPQTIPYMPIPTAPPPQMAPNPPPQVPPLQETDVRHLGDDWLNIEATIPTEYTPLTAYDEASNPQIPGPSAVPGLWD